MAQVADGSHTAPSKLTVGEYVRERFSQWQADGTITPGTAQRYGQLIDRQIIPYLGAKLVQKLNTRDIEAWHTALTVRGRMGRYASPTARAE